MESMFKTYLENQSNPMNDLKGHPLITSDVMIFSQNFFERFRKGVKNSKNLPVCWILIVDMLVRSIGSVTEKARAATTAGQLRVLIWIVIKPNANRKKSSTE